jgi:hypothetical protein
MEALSPSDQTVPFKCRLSLGLIRKIDANRGEQELSRADTVRTLLDEALKAREGSR